MKPNRKPVAPPPPVAAALVFVTHFAGLKDPRRDPWKVVHPLPYLLLVAFAAILSGSDGWDAFEQFAQDKRTWLQARWPSATGTPSADTFRRVFNRLDPTAFAACLTRWTRDLATRTAGQVVAFDGKSVAGAHPPGDLRRPMHLVHAWLVEQKLLLGLSARDGVAQEPVAIRDLLALLDLRGAMVTIDAIGATRAITRDVVAAHADDIVQLKRNRRVAFAQVATYFDADGRAGRTTRTRGHGRVETRTARAVAAARFPAVVALFAEARSVLRLVRTRRVGTTSSRQTHYYVSSRPPDTPYLASIVRDHWSVENHLHRTLDVVLHEDASQVRKGPAAANLATVRRFAEAALRRDTTYPHSMPKKIRHAAFDDDYRAHLVALEVA